ncbi:MAG: hypothetical protein QOD51_692, partial [Candidatus Eremiobacteraeota bacterium]|nr:hypothetical protein [Candidatus Eremiobacteraeota bacterium]
GVDVFSTVGSQYVLTAGAGRFTGNLPNGAGGPNGVAPVTSTLVYAGDGNSTLKVVDRTSGALVFSSPVLTNPYTGPAIPTAQCPNGGPGLFRTDEVAYDSTDQIFLAINDLSCPPFGTFFSTTNPSAPTVVGQVSFPTALTLTTTTPNTPGGVEQPVWDPKQDVFLVPIPGTLANPNGEVDVISPKTFKITKVYPITTNCQPNGAALGASENLFLGCSATTGTLQLLEMDATNGNIIASIPGIAGGDEVWYNRGTDMFYCACSNNPASAGGPVIAVVLASRGLLFQTIPTSAGAHSIAADPDLNAIYLPQRPATAANDGVSVYYAH